MSWDLAEPLPAPRTAVTRKAYEAVRRAIISGSLTPGTPLNERQLAAQFGVSRTPVREALAMLATEELAVLGSSGQLVVREVTVTDIRETYDVRVMLEGYGARLAAAAATADDIERLRSLNDQLRKSFRLPAPEQDVAAQTRLDAAFHKGIAAASGNRALARLVGQLVDTPIRERAFFWFSRRRHLQSVTHHAEVIDALERRDPDEAERLWQAHIRVGGESLIAHLNESRGSARADELWASIEGDSQRSAPASADPAPPMTTADERD